MSVRLIRTQFDPRRIANLYAWFDSSVGSSISLNGTAVSEWRDLSGNGRHVTQSTASAQPALTTGGRNGLAVVTFDGNDSLVGNGAFLAGNPSFSFFVAYRKTTATNGHAFGWGDASAGLGAAGIYDDNSSVAFAFAGANNRPITQVPNNTWLLHSGTKPANAISGMDVFRNGANCNTGTPSAQTPNISTSPLRIGQWASFSIFPLIGDIGSFLVYDRSLSNAERQWVERGLMQQWAIE